MQVKGYKALAVPLTADEATPFTAFVYVRQHSSKGYVMSCWPRSPVGCGQSQINGSA